MEFRYLLGWKPFLDEKDMDIYFGFGGGCRSACPCCCCRETIAALVASCEAKIRVFQSNQARDFLLLF